MTMTAQTPEFLPFPGGDRISVNTPPMFNIADTCCGKCPGATCYVDLLTGERA